MQQLFLVAQMRPTGEDPTGWEFQRVFSTVEKAEQACRNRNYFYKPVTLDEELSDETLCGDGTEVYPIT
jgi:hypothetical protein